MAGRMNGQPSNIEVSLFGFLGGSIPLRTEGNAFAQAASD